MIPFHILSKALKAEGDLRKNALLGADLEQRREELKKDPWFKSSLAEIFKEADEAAQQPPSQASYSLFRLYEVDGTRNPYQQVYFDSRRRLLALGLGAWLDQTDTYLAPLQETIWQICNEYTWCLPAHLPYGLAAVQAATVPPRQTVDLFSSETAQALAEVDYLLGDRLDPWIRYRIRQEVGDRVFSMFDKPNRLGWESATMNWASVCGGSVGMAAMLLQGDGKKETERLAVNLDRVIQALECFLEGYGEDGGCAEGIGYWTYGFGYYVYFVEMLWELTEGTIDLLDSSPKLRNMASFPSEARLSGNTFVNFSDAPFRSDLPTGLLSRLQQRLSVETPGSDRLTPFHSDHCYRWAPKLRDLLWTQNKPEQSLSASLSRYLPDLQWFIDEHKAGDSKISFAAKGGHNAEPHNHNDLGHFLLHVGEEALLSDLGAGLYIKDSFSDSRYELLHNRSLGHSVPLIAGHEQLSGKEREAKVLIQDQSEACKHFELDLTAAYEVKALSRLVRSFKWNALSEGKAELQLKDQFQFLTAGVEYEEIWISGFKPDYSDGVVVWTGRGGMLEMTYEPNRYSVSVDEIDSADHHGAPIKVYRTRLKRTADSLEEIFACRFTATVTAS